MGCLVSIYKISQAERDALKQKLEDVEALLVGWVAYRVSIYDISHAERDALKKKAEDAEALLVGWVAMLKRSGTFLFCRQSCARPRRR